jgi:hypothetical protein
VVTRVSSFLQEDDYDDVIKRQIEGVKLLATTPTCAFKKSYYMKPVRTVPSLASLTFSTLKTGKYFRLVFDDFEPKLLLW